MSFSDLNNDEKIAELEANKKYLQEMWGSIGKKGLMFNTDKRRFMTEDDFNEQIEACDAQIKQLSEEKNSG